jgi:hypothetical protein
VKAYILTGPDPAATPADPRVELRADHIAIIAHASDVDIGRDQVTVKLTSRAAARQLAYLLRLAEDAADADQFSAIAPAGPTEAGGS